MDAHCIDLYCIEPFFCLSWLCCRVGDKENLQKSIFQYDRRTFTIYHIIAIVLYFAQHIFWARILLGWQVRKHPIWYCIELLFWYVLVVLLHVKLGMNRMQTNSTN